MQSSGEGDSDTDHQRDNDRVSVSSVPGNVTRKNDDLSPAGPGNLGVSYQVPTFEYEVDNDSHSENPLAGDEDILPEAGNAKNVIWTRRPNAYVGPKSTWQHWTREERTVAKSLDHERAQNLSIHLYNAYMANALPNRARERLLQSNTLEESALLSLTSDEVLTMPSQWTAWPLPPRHVPRERFMPRLGGLGPTENESSSQILTNWIAATISRRARRIWAARAWDEDPLQKDTYPPAIEDLEKSLPTEPTAKSSPSARDSDDPVSAPPMFSSQALVDSASDGVEEDVPVATLDSKKLFKYSDIDMTPIPIADNERVLQLLQSSARHIVSKFDELLMALHKARLAYSDKQGGITSEDGTQDEESDIDTGSNRINRRNLSRSRKRRRDSSTDTPSSAKSARSGRQRHRKLMQRNWSDVVGMAALMGWDQEVVERTSERCAAIFNANMLFRTFHEGDENCQSYFTERLATGEEPKDGEDGTIEVEWSEFTTSDDNFGAEKGRSRCCPYPSCNRHDDPFTKRSGLIRHLRELHHHEEANSVGGKSELPLPLDRAHLTITCPVKGCKRQGYLFSARSKLYRHLRTYHPQFDLEEYKKVDEIRLASERRGNRTASAATKMSHYCPVPGCPTADFPYGKAEYLRQHMKRRHPGISLKSMEARPSREVFAKLGQIELQKSKTVENDPGKDSESSISGSERGK